MKNPERVAELLAELRALTESDFERHRLDVLDRDLAAPPTVEVLDEDYQKFDGILYRKRKPQQNSQACHYQQSIQLHQVVWRYHNGDIPSGCHIHHRDFNPANNDITNLQCLTAAEHQMVHRTREHSAQKKPLVCKNCGKTFFASRGDYLYCSIKCKNAFYRSSQKTQEAVCEWCGKSFLTHPTRPNRFCSCSCSSKWRTSQH